MTRSIVWVKPEGAEYAEIELGPESLTARGGAIGGGPPPYRLEYELATGARYVTARLRVRASGTDPGTGPWSRTLELVNRPAGEWTVHARAEGRAAMPPPGGDADALAGALDCDLGLSPLTNTMPVLREDLLAGGGPVEYLMAWISVPELVVTPARQTYTFVRRTGEDTVINYADADFTEDVVFTPDGLVRDYPSIARRV